MNRQAESSMSTFAVPVLDVSRFLAKDTNGLHELAMQIRSALGDIGFMVLVGHDVPDSVIDAAFVQARRFHAQPLESKQALAMNEHNNGYMAQGRYSIVTSQHHETDQPELNESFFFKRERSADDPQVRPGRRFVGENLWPHALPEFKRDSLLYANAMNDFAVGLLPAFAVALDLDPHYFDACFENNQFSVRFSHYPPAARAANRFGIAAHSDMNFMTLLPQSALSGLQVKMPDGIWCDIPHLPGSIAVNAGDTLHRWSNGRFKSTPHRALPPEHDDRYAIPVFVGPNIDTRIECLPSCLDAQTPARWPPISYEDWMLYWYDTNYNHREQAEP